MNILYISNYDAHRRIAEGWMPSHHIFGIGEILECFDSKSSAIIKQKYGGGKVDFLVLDNPSKKDIFLLYLRLWGGQYDIVFDALNVVSKYFAVLNKYHLFRPRLITNYHHPPFCKIMKYGKSDCSVFFTEDLLKEAAKDVHDGRCMVYNNWYPDKIWYDSNRKMMDRKVEYDFLDNGKTSRNHDLFIRCMREMPDKKAVIVTDRKHIPSEYKEGENVELYLQDKPNDYTMEQLCLNSKVMVIPLEENNAMLGPIGNTSYMDAIALGMPVVTNRKAAYAKEISANDLGVLFDSTEDSMRTALLKSLENYSELSKNMNRFSENHTIQNYSEELIKYLK